MGDNKTKRQKDKRKKTKDNKTKRQKDKKTKETKRRQKKTKKKKKKKEEKKGPYAPKVLVLNNFSNFQVNGSPVFSSYYSDPELMHLDFLILCTH